MARIKVGGAPFVMGAWQRALTIGELMWSPRPLSYSVMKRMKGGGAYAPELC